eukprot:CAMPEP_0114153736 /NCGR_PEP_ID=MMETSP0043_2-20121206/24524_1 /TAXON_ID=464988 /ORGANISM="Hemiselmis andersenii, Strain CCMP644" /LENGTH=58 /DNA_ID=CAMNT_0001248811 /DNA_START=15 /DNA_END=188 /DNA_ORIENTATION=-
MSLLEIVFEACPASALARDDHGRTPLHVLCASSPHKWLPISWLARTAPSTVEAKDNRG